MQVVQKVAGNPAPMERIQLPAELDGSRGTNRMEPMALQIGATTDLEAIRIWLHEYADSPQTQRTYRKEAERLLLWALLERGKPLSSLTRDDFMAYQAFLADPQPRQRWCGPKAPRSSSAWRPFTGPLTASSQRQTMVILNSLFNYLVMAGYLRGNPIALMRRRARAQPGKQQAERFLDQTTWRYLLDYLEALPQETVRQQNQYERLRFLLALLYLLGPRVSEVAGSRMNDFVERRGRWWWRVIGKGQKEGMIPVNDDMLNALIRYRRHLGLSSLPTPDDDSPLLRSLKGTKGLGANMVYRLVKQLVQEAATALEADDPVRAHKLRQASTHWFRHTSITHQADAGIELRLLNRNARHSKLETTAIYLHAEEEQWHSAMDKHRLVRDND